MRTPPRNRIPAFSVALMALLLAVCVASYWRKAGLLHIDETWVVIPTSHMKELHTTLRVALVGIGRIELSEADYLSAVIPAGSSAAGETKHEWQWVWQAPAPGQKSPAEDRWHVTQWNEWRAGDFGWYVVSAPGSARVFSVPLWLVIALVGTPFWIRLARAGRAWRRSKRGLCLKCAYDRRAIASGTPCPECGASDAESVPTPGSDQAVKEPTNCQ